MFRKVWPSRYKTFHIQLLISVYQKYKLTKSKLDNLIYYCYDIDYSKNYFVLKDKKVKKVSLRLKKMRRIFYKYELIYSLSMNANRVALI